MSDAAPASAEVASSAHWEDLESALLRADYTARIAEIVGHRMLDDHSIAVPSARKRPAMTLELEDADVLLWAICEAADAANAALEQFVGKPRRNQANS